MSQQDPRQPDNPKQGRRTGPDTGNPRGHDIPSPPDQTQRDTSRGVEAPASTNANQQRPGADDDAARNTPSDVDAAAPGHEIDDTAPKPDDPRHRE